MISLSVLILLCNLNKYENKTIIQFEYVIDHYNNLYINYYRTIGYI